MITLRALLAGLAASMARDEAEAVRTAAKAEAPADPVTRVLVDPLVQDDQVETLSLGS